MLLSIHSEEILKYPFLNDPIGLIEDKRFNDMPNFFIQINKLREYCDAISIMSNFKETFEEIFNGEDLKLKRKILKEMEKTMIEYKKSIISLFEIIINEYKNCEITNISKEKFIKKLEEFLNDSEYNIAFGFDNDEINVKENIINIINDFKNDKTLSNK